MLCALLLTVSTLRAAGVNITWTGTNGSAWDTNNTVNWNNAGSPSQFFATDNVTFDDTSTNGNVMLSGSLVPNSVTVNNGVTAYTFGGAGEMGGATGLLKSGTGMLTISNTNVYTGGTVISAGILMVTSGSALGSGTTTLDDTNTGANNTSFFVSQSGTSGLTYSNAITVSSLGSGTVSIGRSGTGSGSVTISSHLALGRLTTFESSPNGQLNLTGIFSGTGSAIFTGGGVTALNATTSGSGASLWAGSVSVTGTSVVTTGTTTDVISGNRNVNIDAGSGLAFAGGSGTYALGSVTGGGTTPYTFSGSGQIVGSASIVKSGSGSLTITGTQAYTGATTVNGGSLVVNGNIASSSGITVSSGASLSGHGTVGAIGGSGSVAPGDPQILTGSNVDPGGGLSFRFQFGQAGAPIYSNAAASGNDVLHLEDSTPFTMALTSANTITVDFTGLTLTQGEIFYGGFFTNADISDAMISGATFQYTGIGSAVIEYIGLVNVPTADFADGTVTNGEVMEFFVAIPEPDTSALVCVGILGLSVFAKRNSFKKNSLH